MTGSEDLEELFAIARTRERYAPRSDEGLKSQEPRLTDELRNPGHRRAKGGEPVGFERTCPRNRRFLMGTGEGCCAARQYSALRRCSEQTVACWRHRVWVVRKEGVSLARS